jgi:hypothetical protein
LISVSAGKGAAGSGDCRAAGAAGAAAVGIGADVDGNEDNIYGAHAADMLHGVARFTETLLRASSSGCGPAVKAAAPASGRLRGLICAVDDGGGVGLPICR